jgi:sugar/nucleoside kinase (ribokinase family)
VVKAKESGARITFDPNIRLSIWESPEKAREVIRNALTLADILKISEDDFQFLFPDMDEREACERLYLENGTEMIIITKAERGCFAYVNQDSYLSSAYDVPVVDTTGSGDAFLAGIIFNLMKLNKNIHDMSSVEITVMLDFANAVGSLVCTKPGAIVAFPTPREIVLCMEKIPKRMQENTSMSIWE